MMRRVLRIGFALVLVLGGVAIWKQEQLLRLHAVNTLFAQDRIVNNFSTMRAAFNTVGIVVNGVPDPIPSSAGMVLPDDWQDWLQRRAVTGVVIVQDGQIVHEAYHLGTGAQDQRISWSLAKSYLSALFGVLHASGDVENLDDPVTKYAPALAGTAYDQATIRNVLQMSTGVVFDEDYLDFWSDINKMGRILALGGSMDGFAAGLTETDQSPGAAWRYVSIDTHVLGMVLRGATGRSIPELLGEHLLEPLGTYGEPHYITDGYGVAFVLGGLNLTTRDYARLGELFRLNGRFQGREIVPESWVVESTTPSAKTQPGNWQYGYQWWMAHDAPEGEIMARGIYGQYIYINRNTGTVIALNAADRQFREAGAHDDALQMFRRIANQGARK